MRKRIFFLIGLGVLVLVFVSGFGLAEAASNIDIIDQGVGLNSVDSTLKQLARGIVRLARPIVAIMTAIAGVMVVLNIGDSKRPMWNAILGIGLIVHFGDVLWAIWGKYANPQMGLESAIEYSLRIKDTANADGNGVDILSSFMKIFLEIVVTGAERIKPIAIKMLLLFALIDSSIRLALDLTEKDKVSWLVKTFLRIGFYVFLIQNWIGIDGLNLMDTLSKGFQEIGFMAGNYGHALPTSATDIQGIDPKDNLSPDSIVNNGFKMVSAIFGAGSAESTGTLESAKRFVGGAVGIFGTGGFGPLVVIVTVVVSILCIFLTGIEMFMARIEFYTLALLGLPLLAFGVIKHFEYLAQQTIRAMFNCGVKLCVISFLQAIVCRMFTRYINNVVDAQTGLFKDMHILDNYGHLLATLFQLMIVSIIMYLLVSQIPKLIQGLLSGNPSLGGSDMTGTVTGAATTAASTAAMVAGAHTAAVKAREAKAAGDDTISPWKMSEMGQFGAALMRRAPITGSAYSAYREVAEFGRDNNRPDGDRTSKGEGKEEIASSKESQEMPSSAAGGDNGAPPSLPLSGGGGASPHDGEGVHNGSGSSNGSAASVQYRSPSAPSQPHRKVDKFSGVGKRTVSGQATPASGPRLYPPRKKTDGGTSPQQPE